VSSAIVRTCFGRERVRVSPAKLSAVLSVTAIGPVEIIDSGDTLALRLTKPDGDDIALLIGSELCAALHDQLGAALEEAKRRRVALPHRGKDPGAGS
jgi:hypothetical protein